MKILVLNGPNINRLGKREPAVYGNTSYEDLIKLLQDHGHGLGLQVVCLQSNHEGDLIDWIQEESFDGLIINPAGYSHTSVAMMDALLMRSEPIIEVHISQVHQRESFRSTLLTAKAATATVSGMGVYGYVVAMTALKNHFLKND